MLRTLRICSPGGQMFVAEYDLTVTIGVTRLWPTFWEDQYVIDLDRSCRYGPEAREGTCCLTRDCRVAEISWNDYAS